MTKAEARALLRVAILTLGLLLPARAQQWGISASP